jgi:hypothetical protein
MEVSCSPRYYCRDLDLGCPHDQIDAIIRNPRVDTTKLNCSFDNILKVLCSQLVYLLISKILGHFHAYNILSTILVGVLRTVGV